MLFYNNALNGYSAASRNPYWLTAGVEAAGGSILWSQPEIALYGREVVEPGYPDFIEDPKSNTIFITETQKSISRLHRIPADLVEGLFQQQISQTRAPGGLPLSATGSTSLPQMPLFNQSAATAS